MKLVDRIPVQSGALLAGLMWMFIASPSYGQEMSRWSIYETFQGSSNSAGQVLKLDTSLNYSINEYFDLGGGVPFYFVRGASTDTTASTGFNAGLGNTYFNLKGRLTGERTVFVSTVTAGVPTGDRDRGFSTGRVTVDWNNYFAVPVSRFTPFANIGVANTVSDTAFFVRPFTSLGAVGHFEGGTTISLMPFFSLGASAYNIAPGRNQRIVSKVKRAQAGPPTQTINPPTQTINDADLARDHGFNTWVELAKTPEVSFQLGYNRSIRNDFDSVFFGLGFNISSIVRKQ